MLENKDWAGEGLLNEFEGWFEFENKLGTEFWEVTVFVGWLVENRLGFGCSFCGYCLWLFEKIFYGTGV